MKRWKYGKSASGNPLTKFVNMFQTAEERNLKYAYARACGFNTDKARHLRSWRWCRIVIIVEASATTGLITIDAKAIRRLQPRVAKFLTQHGK